MLEKDFNALHKLYDKEIRKFLSVEYPSMSSEDMEDSLQDTWANVWKYYDSAPPTQASMGTWLCNIAINCVRKHMKETYPADFLHEVDSEEDDAPWDTPEIVEEFLDEQTLSPEEEAEKSDALTKFLGGLALREAEVTTLYLAGHTYKEIGELVGTSPNNVAQTLWRVRQKAVTFGGNLDSNMYRRKKTLAT